jgi:hypothetical protein
MKNFIYISILFLTYLVLPVYSMAQSDEGFINLFDGKNTDAWTTKGDWKVINGILELESKGDYVMVNSNYLWTKKTYDDFILELDFKITDESLFGLEKFNGKGRPGNSGVFIRVGDKGNPVQTGMEIQVGQLKPGDEIERGSVGGVFDLYAPVINAYVPGNWNHYEISCKGSWITVKLNGKETAKINLDKWTIAGVNPDGSKNKFKRPLKEFARSGYIGLQDHGTPASFKNIRIKEL